MPRPDLSSLGRPRHTHRLVLRPLTPGDTDSVLAHRRLAAEAAAELLSIGFATGGVDDGHMTAR